MRKTFNFLSIAKRTGWSALVGAAVMMVAGTASAQQDLLGRDLDDPWTLLNAPGFDWGGWSDIGWQDRADGSFTDNGTALNQHEHGRVNMNQLYTYVTKVADGSEGLDWGFRFDAMWGVDGNEAQSFGNVTPGYWDYLNGFGGPGDPVEHGPYEFAFPQAYGEVAFGDLSIKMGHFYTIVGYETVTAPDNFFLSRSLTFYNSEPFTHTGALASYAVSDNFTISGGWTLGWNTGFYQFGGGSNFIGGFTYNFSDYVSLIYTMTGGNFGERGTGACNSLILTAQVSERLTAVVQADVLGTDLGTDFNDGAGAPADNSTGLLAYTYYQFTDLIAVGGRSEWYKADGTSYYEFTNGLNIRPLANLIFRPEARYQNAPGNQVPLFADRWIFGCDMIFTF